MCSVFIAEIRVYLSQIPKGFNCTEILEEI